MKDAVLARIGQLVPMQMKKIDRFFAECPEASLQLERFLETYKPFMELESISIEMVVDAYLEMINQIMQARIEFIRTGRYPAQDQKSALEQVYSNEDLMKQYMLGLALSYFLWKHHFQLLTFYRESIRSVPSGSRFLEIGCGHGLLLLDLVSSIENGKYVEVVDISQHSIDMARGLLRAVLPDAVDDVTFFHCDVFKFTAQHTYDFITIGEVLEHVDDPLALLVTAGSLLAPEGRLFITTCANCPAIDHVYHFKDVEEIRAMIIGAGLTVECEIIAPSERKSPEELRRQMIDISYAALLSKA